MDRSARRETRQPLPVESQTCSSTWNEPPAHERHEGQRGSCCAISATKACGNPVPDVSNSTVTYTISGTVKNTGGGSVENLQITDTFNGNPQAISGLTCSCDTGCTITGSDCATAQIQSGGTVNYSATMVTSANGGTDVVTATMNGLGGGSATASSNTAACLRLP